MTALAGMASPLWRLWAVVLIGATAVAAKWCFDAWRPASGLAHPKVQTLPVFLDEALTPQWLSDTALNALPPSFPTFALTDQSGQPLGKADLKGRVVVANFFFTHCSSVCPSLTSAMAQVQKAYANHPGLLLLSHSVTPQFDTPPMLAAYAQANRIDGKQWRLLTGSEAQINLVAHKGYLVPRTAVGAQGFIHTELFVLLDQAQRVRGVYNASLRIEVEQLVRDVDNLLRRPVL
jgi:protein SCO1